MLFGRCWDLAQLMQEQEVQGQSSEGGEQVTDVSPHQLSRVCPEEQAGLVQGR